MSKIATLQPSSASRRVMARPMPWPPPVTIATLPDKPLNVSLPWFATHWPPVLSWRAPLAPAGREGLTALGQCETTLRKHLAGNDRFHDLNGSARDLDDPGVDIGARDRILRHISPTSEQLQAFVDRFAVKSGGKHLGHRGVHRIQLSLHEERNALIGKNAGDGCLGFQIGKLELRVLEVCEFLTENAPVRGIFDRPIKNGFDDSCRADSLGKPFLREFRHHQREALALLSKHVGGGNAYVLEEQLGSILGFHPDLFEISAALKSRSVALDDEQRHALGARAAVGFGREHDEIAELAVRDENFLAVDNEIVSVANGAVPERLEVPPRMGLRHA